MVQVRVIVLYIDIAVIVHVEEGLVGVRVLGLLLAVGLPDVVLALALEAVQLLLVGGSEVGAALAVELVVVVRGLQDRVVLCLQVASVVHCHVLVEGVVPVVVLVRNLVLADRARGRDALPSRCVLDQSRVLPELGPEAALLDGARLAASFFNLSFHEVALLLFYIWRSGWLDEFDEAAIALEPIVEHWGTDVAVGR